MLKKYIIDKSNKEYIVYLYRDKSIYSRSNSNILNYDSLFNFLISQDRTYWFSISQLRNRDILNDEVNNLFKQEDYKTLNSIITIKQFKKICIVICKICKILLNTANNIEINSSSLFIINLLSTLEETQPLERCKQGIIEMIQNLIKEDQIKGITDDSKNKLANLRLKIIKNIHPEYAHVTHQDLLDIKNRQN